MARLRTAGLVGIENSSFYVVVKKRKFYPTNQPLFNLLQSSYGMLLTAIHLYLFQTIMSQCTENRYALRNGRHLIVSAACSVIGMILAVWVGVSLFYNLPVSTDEGSYLFQVSSFQKGVLVRPYPAMGTILRRPDDMLIMDETYGWVSRYPPGHALWLLSGAFLGYPRFMVLLACGLSIAFVMMISKQLGAIPLAAGMFLLLSPFYLTIHGTLLSHSTGFLAVSMMLWSYIKHQRADHAWFGVLAGLAWSLLFLNRPYTAFLIAIPFGVDALWQLARTPNRLAWLKTTTFAASACVGLFLYMAYNYLVTGDPSLPTYLLYDDSQTLGFGMRHLRGLPVDHSFSRGLTNAWQNLLTLDRWLLGTTFGLVFVLVLAAVGTTKRWAWLMWGGAGALVVGYVFFWFPGPRHIGPAYYFEAMPFLVSLAVLGFTRVWYWSARWRTPRLVMSVVLVLVFGLSTTRFMLEQKEYFNAELYTQRGLAAVLDRAPPDALIFLRNVSFPLFGRITFNAHGVDSDPLVMSCPGPEHYPAVLYHYPERTAYFIDEKEGHALHKIEPDDSPAVPAVFWEASRLPALTGSNVEDEDGTLIRAAQDSDDEKNYLVYGSRPLLSPGMYVARFYIDYASGKESSQSRLDVAADLGQELLAVKEVPEVFEKSAIELPFTISGNDFKRVEPRVFYGGIGTIFVRAISLYPVDE